MKFTKYNNPNRKRIRKHTHSRSYCIEMQNEMYQALANAETEADKDMIIKAYNISLNPTINK